MDHWDIFSCSETWERCLHHGAAPIPAFHPISKQEVKSHIFFLPLKAARWKGGMLPEPGTLGQAHPLHPCLKPEGVGWDPEPLPLLFSSASFPATPSSRHIPRREGAACPRGEGPETPAPPCHAGLPLIVPRGGGGGLGETGPAPLAATQEASGGAPAVPPHGSGP